MDLIRELLNIAVSFVIFLYNKSTLFSISLHLILILFIIIAVTEIILDIVAKGGLRK